MASTGMRGGRRVGSGRKSKSKIEKIESGNPGHRPIKTIEVAELETVDVDAYDMPSVKEYLSAQQRDGKNLEAAEIYKDVWLWLRSLKCEKLVYKNLIEQYAMSVARWIQCQEAISKYGLIAKHPTTENPIQSPYVAMEQAYAKQVAYTWIQIFQIVKENSSVDYRGPNPNDNIMERLLRTKGV